MQPTLISLSTLPIEAPVMSPVAGSIATVNVRGIPLVEMLRTSEEGSEDCFYLAIIQLGLDTNLNRDATDRA